MFIQISSGKICLRSNQVMYEKHFTYHITATCKAYSRHLMTSDDFIWLKRFHFDASRRYVKVNINAGMFETRTNANALLNLLINVSFGWCFCVCCIVDPVNCFSSDTRSRCEIQDFHRCKNFNATDVFDSERNSFAFVNCVISARKILRRSRQKILIVLHAEQVIIMNEHKAHARYCYCFEVHANIETSKKKLTIENFLTL